MKEEIWKIILENTFIRGIDLEDYKRSFEDTLSVLEEYIENKEENAFNLATEVDFSTMNYKYPTFKDYKNEK